MNLTAQRYRVGIVGLQPGRSWAARAHIPALRSLPDSFEVAGVANSSASSAVAAAEACGIPRAFASVDEMVRSPEIDIVAVTVKVPHHLDLVTKAVAAGKHVYSEWPLGRNLVEAQQMADHAKERGITGVIGNQARVSPEIQYLRQLIHEGYVGRLLSTTITAWGRSWGSYLDSETTRAYLLDRANGATMLTIPIGHTLAALQDALGSIVSLSSLVRNQRTEVPAIDTGRILPMNAPDQILFNGLLDSGAPISLHYRGGESPSGPGFVWEINGVDGNLRLTAANGSAQMVGLDIAGAKATEGKPSEGGSFVQLPVPADFQAGWPDSAIVGNVARLYARMASDLRHGTDLAPKFCDAVELHRLLDTIEKSSDAGKRLSTGSLSRALPLEDAAMRAAIQTQIRGGGE